MLFSAIETFDSAILFSFRFLDSFFVITNFALVVFIILCFFIFEIFLIDIKFLSISFFIRNYFFYGFNKIINVVYIVVKSQLMKNYKHAYFLMFSTIFLQIMFSNLFGIFIGFSVSSLLIFTFYLSSLVWGYACYKGFNLFGFGFLNFFVPSVDKALLPFICFIEVCSYIIRLFSLSLRLTANITAGHVLLMTLLDFCVKLAIFNWFLFFFSICMFVFVFALELGVAFLQAYVFVTLGVMYLNDSLSFDASKH